ncbi:MAG: glucokinase [Methanotrichaceae archaeon]|nr:glucokinase [Methanotrichaceae archaeon]
MISKGDYASYVLGVDIGGTHTNLGVAGVASGKATLLYSTHFQSQELSSLIPAIRGTLNIGGDRWGIEVKRGCAGGAGPALACRRSRLTNVPWDLDADEIEREFGFDGFYIINDFQAIGYGIDLLGEGDLLQAKAGAPGAGETRAIIGAGTGLGKAILIHEDAGYRPHPSEGGHGDFPLHDDFDLELARSLRGDRKTPLSYEDVLSGRGIEGIYAFLSRRDGGSRRSREIFGAGGKAALISKHRFEDDLCREAFSVYARCYARCAKNFVLDCLATGGLYIAGGIAAKNADIFLSSEFHEEFLKAEKQRSLLERTPIHVILNYDVSLYGACHAATIAAYRNDRPL